MSETKDLKVRVADAQGLRLKSGGEIRLVITLCASDDLQGEAFGAKVTPWLKAARIPGLTLLHFPSVMLGFETKMDVQNMLFRYSHSMF